MRILQSFKYHDAFGFLAYLMSIDRHNMINEWDLQNNVSLNYLLPGCLPTLSAS